MYCCVYEFTYLLTYLAVARPITFLEGFRSRIVLMNLTSHGISGQAAVAHVMSGLFLTRKYKNLKGITKPSLSFAKRVRAGVA